MRAEKVMDFGMQMASPPGWRRAFPSRSASSCDSGTGWCCSTSTRDTGHAQRVALSSLFGRGVDDDLALTAVGDPIQSIYGWRGASATNLRRFAPTSRGRTEHPRPRWSCAPAGATPPRALHLAQCGVRRGAAPFRRGAAPAAAARCRAGRPVCAAVRRCSRTWIGTDHLAQRPRRPRSGAAAPTAAVLVRRNADRRADGRRAARARRPGRGRSASPGLLAVPRLPTWWRRCAWWPILPRAAAMRVLTGPRWRLGGRDIAALWRRAVDSSTTGRRATPPRRSRSSRRPPPDADAACLADAICDPGPAAAYSAAGHRRICRARPQLSARCARHLVHPLPDLVAEVRRVLGRRHRRSGRPAGVIGLVRHRATRRVRRRGGRLRRPVRRRRCRVCWRIWMPPSRWRTAWRPPRCPSPTTACRSSPCTPPKGLEWQVVAVPHLSGRVFPSTRVDAAPGSPTRATCRRCCAGDRATDLRTRRPGARHLDVNDRKRLVRQDLRSQAPPRAAPDRRGTPAAVTSRSPAPRTPLLLSGHHWGVSEAKPRGPSDFSLELKDIIRASPRTTQPRADPCGVVGHMGTGACRR